MTLDTLAPPDRAFVEQLAALNGLTPDAALSHLLDPGKTWGWQPGATVVDGHFTELKLGSESGQGHLKFNRVPAPVGLERLASLSVVGGCQLPEEAHVDGPALAELHIHSQRGLVSLRTGRALRSLSLMGDPVLARVDIRDSVDLGFIELFETKALVAGIRCWDVQKLSVSGLSRLGKRIDADALEVAGPELVAHLLEVRPDLAPKLRKHPNAPAAPAEPKAPRSAPKAPSRPRAPAMMGDAEALERFGEWLAHPLELGRPAASLEIVHRQVVEWGGDKVRVFLVRWTDGEGGGFVGITGPFSWSFMGLPEASLEALKPKTRMRRLVNLYFGWYAAFAGLQAHGPQPLDAATFEAEWARDLARTQVNLNRGDLCSGAELLGNTWSTAVPGRDISVRCLAPPDQVKAVDGVTYVAVKARLTYRLNGGEAEADQHLFFTRSKPGRLKGLRQLSTEGHGVIDALPLYHWVGCHLGPVEFRTFNSLSLFDH